MDIEKLIERLKHNYHGYSTVENNPEETFHDMVECLTALSTLQAENEKLREMYQKEKAVCHEIAFAQVNNARKLPSWRTTAKAIAQRADAPRRKTGMLYWPSWNG